MLMRNGFHPVSCPNGTTFKGKEGDIQICNVSGVHGHVRCQVEMSERGNWRVIHFEDGKAIPWTCCPDPSSPSTDVFDQDNSLMMEAIQRGWERIILTKPT